VALVGGSFLALVARPFLFEFGGGHGSVANLASLVASGMARSVRREPGGGKKAVESWGEIDTSTLILSPFEAERKSEHAHVRAVCAGKLRASIPGAAGEPDHRRRNP
jgi:hypothetical protein